MIKTHGSELTRLKEIPVPQSVAATSLQGTTTFQLPREYLRAQPAPGAAPGSSYSATPYSYGARRERPRLWPRAPHGHSSAPFPS